MRITSMLSSGVAVLGLTACGGGGSTGAQPQFAGAEPPAGVEDIVGLTFPLRVASLGVIDGVVGDVVRDTWSLRYTTPTSAVLTSDYGTFSLTEDGDQLVGNMGNLSVEITTGEGGEYLALLLIQTSDDIEDTGALSAGFFGLETPVSGVDELIENDAGATYEGGGILYVEYGPDTSDIEQFDGSTELGVDFSSGAVAGTLLETESSSVSLLGGAVSGNGFTGSVGVSGDLGLVLSIAESDVQGFFFGGAAEEVGGSYGGTGTYAAQPATFGGIFGGQQVP